jgi:hypothetical protein
MSDSTTPLSADQHEQVKARVRSWLWDDLRASQIRDIVTDLNDPLYRVEIAERCGLELVANRWLTERERKAIAAELLAEVRARVFQVIDDLLPVHSLVGRILSYTVTIAERNDRKLGALDEIIAQVPIALVLARIRELLQTQELKLPGVATGNGLRGMQEGQQESKEGQQTKTQAELAVEYDAVYKTLVTEKETLLERIHSELLPRLKASVALRWQAESEPSQALRQELFTWISEQINGLGLSFFDHATDRPARFLLTGRGEFRLVPVGEHNPTITRSNIMEVLPHFQFGSAANRKRTKTEEEEARRQDDGDEKGGGKKKR